MLTVYGIGNCDSIRKTLAWLQSQSTEYRFHDYKKQGLSRTLLKEFLKHFTYGELINTRGSTWRNLDAGIKKRIDQTSAIRIMMENPSLIRRPLINLDSQWMLGFEPDTRQAIIKTSKKLQD
jgi:arsenate reductase (glutaredoxin)